MQANSNNEDGDKAKIDKQANSSGAQKSQNDVP